MASAIASPSRLISSSVMTPRNAIDDGEQIRRFAIPFTFDAACLKVLVKQQLKWLPARQTRDYVNAEFLRSPRDIPGESNLDSVTLPAEVNAGRSHCPQLGAACYPAPSLGHVHPNNSPDTFN
ncbi:MAG: hypothetical protein ACPGWS_07670, partial [Solirubrobacterales bacterium]